MPEFPALKVMESVFVHTTEARIEGDALHSVVGYGMTHGVHDAMDDGSGLVPVEMCIPGSGLWADIDGQVTWTGDGDDDEWEEKGEVPPIALIPRKDLWLAEEVGTLLDPGCGRPTTDCKFYAMLSSDGVACGETFLCEEHYTDENRAAAAAGGYPPPDAPVPGSWTDVTDNEAAECVVCGSRPALPQDE